MEPMIRILEFLTAFNWLILPEVLLAGLLHADWRGAYDRRGAAGIVREMAASVVGTNSYLFMVPLSSRWDGRSIRQLLRGYGIEMWGWGFHNHQMFFHVRREDAWNARDIMLYAGVDLAQ